MLYNIVKELSSRCVLHDEIQLLLSLNNFVELDHLRMLHNLEDMYFSGNPFNISNIYDLALLQDFYSNFSLCENVHADLNFSESTFSDSLSQDVLAHFTLVRF